MPPDDLRQSLLQRTDQELAAEKAAALRRITETLEGLLAELEVLRARYVSACPADRAHVRERYDQTCARAEEYRWYLRVQRDAVGFRRHDDLDARYGVAPRLP